MGTIGTGIYTPREVASFTGIAPRRLKRWISGYDFESGGEVRRARPLLPKSDEGPSMTFLHLVEVLFVKAFLDHGVKMRTIREASMRARDMFENPHPFALQRFETDGKRIFAVMANQNRADEVLVNIVDGQASFSKIIARYLKEIDYSSIGEAFRWWPLGKDQPVFVDPKFSFGSPITKTGHVPTYTIHCALKSGDSAEDVARWFEIPLEEVRAAEQFQQRHAA